MKNKVEAINKHYLSGDTSKGSYVPYKALLPATRQWVNSETNPKALYKGGFVNVASPESIKFAQGVELEHKILADVYNSLTEVFPDLGIDRIEPLQLEKGISGAVRRTTQEPAKPVVKEEPKAKVTEPEVKVVEPKVEDKPIANKREVYLGLQTRKQELVDLAGVNKQPVSESEYADEWKALEALTSPSLSDENILDRSDLIVKLAGQRNDPAITQFANEILKEAHARVTKDQKKKAATGQHTSFRKVDDPKRAVHQAKLDESRIFAEESMKKGLQSIDKLEELLQGKKPVSPASTAKTTKPEVKIGDTSTEVKGRFTITKTVVSDNTVLSVRTNNETGRGN
jgi:hypothetical protein